MCSSKHPGTHHPSRITHHASRITRTGPGAQAVGWTGSVRPVLPWAMSKALPWAMSKGWIGKQLEILQGGAALKAALFVKYNATQILSKERLLCQTQSKQDGEALCFTGPCIDFRCLTSAGRFPCSSLDLWYFLSRESTKDVDWQAQRVCSRACCNLLKNVDLFICWFRMV